MLGIFSNRIIMEEGLQFVSNQQRAVFYAAQLKSLDVAQSLRTGGMRLTDNEIKILTAENHHVPPMLEPIFERTALTPIYTLLRQIHLNYQTLIALLLERPTPSPQNNPTATPSTQTPLPLPEDSSLPPSPRSLKRIRLGGVHLYNQNYAKYLQDQRILQQINKQKQDRLGRRRNQLLRDSVLQQTNDQQEPGSRGDEVTRYILESKDKLSPLNYVSYQPELQQILLFFQHSQQEANDFLARRRTLPDSDVHFSFADFQRDLQVRNSAFKKEVMRRLREILAKGAARQKEMEKELEDKIMKIQSQMQKKGSEMGCQTDLVLDEYMRKQEAAGRELQMRCIALESLKKEGIASDERTNHLERELAFRDSQIEKLFAQLKDQQSTMDNVKRLLREQKSKKALSGKSQKQITKTEKTIEREAEQAISDPISQKAIEEPQGKLRKISNMSYSWRRKVSNDSSIISANQLEGEEAPRKKYVRYNLEHKNEHEEKVQSSSKLKKVRSNEFSVQTQAREERLVLTEVRQDVKQQDREKEERLFTEHIDQTKSDNEKAKEKEKIITTSKSNPKQPKPKTKKEAAKQQPLSFDRKLQQQQQKKPSEKREYKMFQVAEEEGEQQRQSLRNTQRSIVKMLINNVSPVQTDKEIRVTYCTYQQVYSMTIAPTFRSSLSMIDFKRDRHSTETSQPHQNDNGGLGKLLDCLPSMQGVSQPKRDLLRQWKKKLVSNYKHQLLNNSQLEAISTVLMCAGSNRTPLQNLNSYSTNDSTPSPKPTHLHSPSQPSQTPTQIQPISQSTIIQPTKLHNLPQAPQLSFINQTSQEKSDWESRLNGLIRFQAQQTDFPEKFKQMHTKCREGPLCSHVSRYFETILKHLQEKAGRMRPSAVLHVQKIGNSSLEEQAKILRGGNRSQDQLQKAQKHVRNRHSQNLLLPIIRDSKISLHLSRK